MRSIAIVTICTALLFLIGKVPANAQSAPCGGAKYCVSFEESDLTQLPKVIIEARIWEAATGMPVKNPDDLDFKLVMADAQDQTKYLGHQRVPNGAVEVNLVLEAKDQDWNQVYELLDHLLAGSSGILNSFKNSATLWHFVSRKAQPFPTTQQNVELLNQLTKIQIEETDDDSLGMLLDEIQGQIKNDFPNLASHDRILSEPRRSIILVTTNTHSWKRLASFSKTELVPIYVILLKSTNADTNPCEPIHALNLGCILGADALKDSSELQNLILGLGSNYRIEFNLPYHYRGTSGTTGKLLVGDKGTSAKRAEADISLAETFPTRQHLAGEYLVLDAIILAMVFGCTITCLRLAYFWRKSRWLKWRSVGIIAAAIASLAIAYSYGLALGANNDPEKAWMGIFMQEVMETPNPTEQKTIVQMGTRSPTRLPPTPTPTPTVTHSPTPPPTTPTDRATPVLFRALEATAYVIPDSLAPCPQVLTFKGQIRVNGAGSVKYKWELSDSVSSPVQTLSFVGEGLQNVIDFVFSLEEKDLDGTVNGVLMVLEPNAVDSARATININCIVPPTPLPPAPNFPDAQRCISNKQEIIEPQDGSPLSPTAKIQIIRGIAGLVSGVNEKYELDLLLPSNQWVHIRDHIQPIPNPTDLDELGRLSIYKPNPQDPNQLWLAPGWYILRLRLIEKANWPGGNCFSRFYVPPH